MSTLRQDIRRLLNRQWQKDNLPKGKTNYLEPETRNFNPEYRGDSHPARGDRGGYSPHAQAQAQQDAQAQQYDGEVDEGQEGDDAEGASYG